MWPSASAAPGLALMRRYVAHHSRNNGSLAALGARTSTSTTPPQPCSSKSYQRWRSSGVGAHGYSGSQIRLAYDPYMTSAEVRSGYVAAKSAHIGPPSETPNKAA